MKQYLLLLPIIFIIHDMEEIIGFRWFFRNNPTIFDRFPRITKAYKDCTTAGMALAVYEEFIPFFGISLSYKQQLSNRPQLCNLTTKLTTKLTKTRKAYVIQKYQNASFIRG